LWEAVAGRHPRALDDGSVPNAAALVKDQIQRKPMPPLAQNLPGISPRVAACLDRAIALTAEQRFHSAQHFGAELDELAAWYARVTVAVPPGMPMELHEITAWRPPPRAGSGEVPVGEGERRAAMWALADQPSGFAATERSPGSFGTDVLPDPEALDPAADAARARPSATPIRADTDIHIGMLLGALEAQEREAALPARDETAPLSPDALGSDHPVQRRIAALERAVGGSVPMQRLPPPARRRPSGWSAPLGLWPRWLAALFALALPFAAALVWLRGPQPLVLIMAALLVIALVGTGFIRWWEP
jgi:hypothetical protein